MGKSRAIGTAQLPDRERWLAETYESGTDRVLEYRAAMQWHTVHPQQGSHVASQVLELPRGRLRTWFDGGKPNAQHAIDTAESHGWLDAIPGESTFEGLSVLHAWILAGGSIANDTFVPSLAIGPSDPTELAYEAFKRIGMASRSVNDVSTKRAQEIRPRGQGRSHLGRFLHGVLGAPIGEKTQIGTQPLQYLESVPQMTLLRWCQTYITLRGTSIDSARGSRLTRLGEKRSQRYRDGLATLLRDLVGNDAQITVTQRSILLGEDMVEMLDHVPTFSDLS